jgi:carbamoyltransferase
MGDGGLCVGAAWLAHQKKTNTMPIAFETALLGNEITSPEVREALDGSGLDYEEIKDIEIHVASELAREQPVVRVAGRMEFGPRALGNRSILCNANDPTINNWLNTRLHRSEFMPFAPATLSSVADQYFLGVKNLGTSSEYMTMTVDCTKKMKDEAPAAVHIDGTARPQIVSVERYPELHKILTHYRKVTGLGNIINTSFNMHEEPIVRNAEDAIRAFKRSGLPWLALNNYLIKGRT